MNKLLIAIVAVLLLAVVGVTWAFTAQKRANRQLAAQIAAANQATTGQKAALEKSRQTVEALEYKITRLIMMLTNSTMELVDTRQRLQELEARAAVGNMLHSPSTDGSDADPASALAPSLVVRTNASGGEQRVALFATLYGTNGLVLGHNLEYSGVYGRRAAFKESASTRRVAFDVDQLHPHVLAHLGINADAQKQRHARQEALWRRVEAEGLRLAAEQAAKREAQRAAAEAARREEEKLLAEQMQREFEWEMQMRAIEDDAIRADAAMRAADAAMFEAFEPPPSFLESPYETR